MDAARPVAQQLTATDCWGSHARPHDVAWVLSLVLPLLPLDARARATCVCRAWRSAASAPALWEELSFERCAVRVSDAALAALCVRAGAALRALRLDWDACWRVTCAEVLAALRAGGCTGLRRLWGAQLDGCGWFVPHQLLSAEMVLQLADACPVLELAACAVCCRPSDAAAVLAALPGPLTLLVEGVISDVDMVQLVECLRDNITLTSLYIWRTEMGLMGATQFAECLRANTTLTTLNLANNDLDEAGATQLAECLRVNATLKSMHLGFNRIGDVGAAQLAGCLRANKTLTSLSLCSNQIGLAGATQLAECLRVNTTLTSLGLARNRIDGAGAVHLAECLCVNTALTSLDLSQNNLGAAGAMQLAECLCVNTTLTSLDLARNQINDVGATHLAECLRISTTLKSLNLVHNNIGDAGTTQLVECLRVNSTLTILNLMGNNIGDSGMRAFPAACPPQCKLLL